MKFAILVAAVLFASPASAEILNPPSGPVEVEDDADMTTADNNAPDDAADMAQVNRRGPAGRMADPAKRAKRQRLRAALMEQFDANGDGRLGPRERQRAIRVLQRLERRLAAGPGQRGQRGMRGQRGPRGGMDPAAGGIDPRARRAQRMRRFIERYDTNGDGNVGPREVPRGAADRLRRFDRNSDGWVEPGEIRQ